MKFLIGFFVLFISNLVLADGMFDGLGGSDGVPGISVKSNLSQEDCDLKLRKSIELIETKLGGTILNITKCTSRTSDADYPSVGRVSFIK